MHDIPDAGLLERFARSESEEVLTAAEKLSVTLRREAFNGRFNQKLLPFTLPGLNYTFGLQGSIWSCFGILK